MSVTSGHKNSSYGSFFNSTIGGDFFHCPFLTDLFNPFAEEIDFKGMSTYSKEYKKHIKKIEKIKQNLDEKETQIYANVLTLMGIISAVFSLITINFEAFANADIDLKFILTFNLSLIFAISVFFGLLYIITNKRKGGSFCFLYVIILILIVVATVLIYRFL